MQFVYFSNTLPYTAEKDLGLTVTEDKVRHLKFLKKLALSRNNIVDIPVALGSMECPEYLNLFCNNLGLKANWKWLASPYIRRNLNDFTSES